MPTQVSRRSCVGGLLGLTAAGATEPRLGLRLWAQGQAGDAEFFHHPGMLHSKSDLIRMAAAVKNREEPVFSGFQSLQKDKASQLTYVPSGAFEEIGRNPTVNSHEFDSDSNAAYQCALMGHITGDTAYLGITRRIVDSWAAKLKRVTGADAVLCAGLGGFKLVNAAELLKYSQLSWPAASIARFGAMLRDVLVPTLNGFAPFANGNWDTAAMKTLMAVAIFNDDPALFDRVLVYYRHGCGDGRLEHYIYANGQCQESGRDQQHTQLGLAHLGDCCEMAWNQGLDLYRLLENRLLKGFEYTARYNLNGEVDFVPDVDRTGQYRHTVISPRGKLRPVYEQIYNHYVRRRGMQAPWLTKAVESLRPEGAAFGADHTGFGTLLYARSSQPDRVPSATRSIPRGIYASSAGPHAISLDWVPENHSAPVALVRSSSIGRKTVTLPPGVDSAVDTNVAGGEVYRYSLSGAGPNPVAAAEMAGGLPDGWTSDSPDRGSADCSGKRWRMMSTSCEMFSVTRTMKPSQALSATLLPEFASQYLMAGLLLRADREMAMVVLAQRSGAVYCEEKMNRNVIPDEPNSAGPKGWALRIVHRTNAGRDEVVHEERVPDPVVSYNRVMRPIVFRIRFSAEGVVFGYSFDALRWQEQLIKLTEHPVAPRAGLCMWSGIADTGAETLWTDVVSTL